ncbi:MAG: creatininase family protein [Desulfobacterales bacterium]|nr:creatininase family protein [Desulfobacterales bacterium]
MKTVKLEELNEHSFKEAKIDKAILAIGSTECHGEHLPFGCDTLVSYDIAKRIAEGLDNTVVCPPLWFGMSAHYMHKPMCITLSDETLIQVISEMLESLIHWGINKVVIINGHDGNIAPIEIATRKTKVAHPEFNLAVLDAWWVTAANLIPEDTFEVWNGLGHGGEGETSIGLSIFPELCDMDRAKGMIPNMDNNVKLVWNFNELTDFGASGAPEKATKEKGDAMKNALVDYLINFVNRMDAQGWKYTKV